MSLIFDRMSALSAPARARLLWLLGEAELGVGELARLVQSPQSTVSRHLRSLLDAGWVEVRREGTSSWFMAADVDADSRALWDVVRAQVAEAFPEDRARLAAVLAAREVDAEAWFQANAGRWSEVRRALYGDGYLADALLALLPVGLRIVDLGCGPGDTLVRLAPHVAKVIGVDREPGMLAVARERTALLPKVEVREGGLDDPPVQAGEVDAALLLLVLHVLQDPVAVLRAAGARLGAGGVVVVVDLLPHDREAYRRTMGHRYLGFDPVSFGEQAAAAGLRVRRRIALPQEPGAEGPPLFLAVLERSGCGG